EYNMTKERYTVGRLPDNDVRVDNPAVSGHHSLIINILNDSFLEDLSSTNGTYVNGKLIKKHALQHGDVVTVGHHQLRFVDSGAEEQVDDDEFARTMVINSSQESVHQAAAKAAGVTETQAGNDLSANYEAAGVTETQADNDLSATYRAATVDENDTMRSDSGAYSAPAPQVQIAKIQVLNGSMAGRELELKKTLTTLGSPGAQVIAITHRADGYYIVKVEGAPKINDEEISSKATLLNDNDVIEVTGVKMGFFPN
ncbi:MAG: FHA domain-containing protein, partial [Gammaproteobacteria bacterium]